MANIAVFALPPKLSFSSHVKTDSLYGKYLLFVIEAVELDISRSLNKQIILPNVNSDLLIQVDSLNLELVVELLD